MIFPDGGWKMNISEPGREDVISEQAVGNQHSAFSSSRSVILTPSAAQAEGPYQGSLDCR
jgi:hypothetical protein